jgi:hypothetical protein
VVVRIGIALASAIIAVGVDAFLVEPHALAGLAAAPDEPEAHAARARGAAGRRTNGRSGRLRARRVQDRARPIAGPDLVRGHYLQPFDRAQYARRRSELSGYLASIQFRAPLGVYAVEGDVDPHGWTQILSAFGAQTFEHTGSIDTGELSITGLARRDSFDRELEAPGSDRFHIVLGHGPDYALETIDADLRVAGHMHGGQVRLPWIGPLMTLSKVPKAWSAGQTELGNGRTLVVSRLRFMCPPEIVVIDLAPAIQTSRLRRGLTPQTISTAWPASELSWARVCGTRQVRLITTTLMSSEALAKSSALRLIV